MPNLGRKRKASFTCSCKKKGLPFLKSSGLEVVERLGRYCVELGAIERIHSRGQHLCKFIATKESFYKRKEYNSHRIFLVHQHVRCFIVWNTNMADVTSRENTLLRFLGNSPPTPPITQLVP